MVRHTHRGKTQADHTAHRFLRNLTQSADHHQYERELKLFWLFRGRLCGKCTVIESVCAVSFRFLLLRMIVVSFEHEKLSRKNGRVAIYLRLSTP